MLYDEYDRELFDSSDFYEMGLRSPRCNGCRYNQLKHKFGNKFLALNDRGWVAVYELDAEPRLGQDRADHEGRLIRSHSSFMSIEHSDECYNWQPPKDW